MRHRKKTLKLGRSSAHNREMLASLVCNLIDRERIKTTLAKAKAARSLAEKMITLGRQGTLAARRNAISKLRQEKHVAKLFKDIVPRFEGRKGGYTRIVKMGRRMSDSSEMAILEWIGVAPPVSKKKSEKKEKA